MSRRKYHTHDPARLSLYNLDTTMSRDISDHQNHVRKPRNTRSDGVAVPTKAHACAMRGGGGGTTVHSLEKAATRIHAHSVIFARTRENRTHNTVKGPYLSDCDSTLALAKCLHCVRTACILRTQRLGYSPKNTCHLFTRGKTETCQYHRVGQVSIDTSGCSYNQQHRRRRTARSWCRLATIEYRRSRAFERR